MYNLAGEGSFDNRPPGELDGTPFAQNASLGQQASLGEMGG